jgi:hypothetical protein
MIDKYTIAANAYVATTRKKNPCEATWFDVAAAYDAGLYHGVNAQKSAEKALGELTQASDSGEQK